MDLHELQLPDNHQETASRFVVACQADNRIMAAFLGGSYAREEADRFSDLDLYFVTTDESYQDFLVEKKSFIRQLGEPLFLEDFGVPHGYCFILSNTTEGEFWFGPESQFKDIYSGPYKVLLDKKNILVGEAFPAPIADPTRQLELLQR
jgi:predicted nucleotidyltransferase